jgi:hypothetical protein
VANLLYEVAIVIEEILQAGGEHVGKRPGTTEVIKQLRRRLLESCETLKRTRPRTR